MKLMLLLDNLTLMMTILFYTHIFLIGYFISFCLALLLCSGFVIFGLFLTFNIAFWDESLVVTNCYLSFVYRESLWLSRVFSYTFFVIDFR